MGACERQTKWDLFRKLSWIFYAVAGPKIPLIRLLPAAQRESRPRAMGKPP